MNPVLKRLQGKIGDGLRDLDAVQTQMRPPADPRAWSIQQIVEHLCMSYASTAEVFENRIARRSATKASPSVRQRIGQIVLVRWGYFPRGRKAPAAVCPANDVPEYSGRALTERAAGLLERLDGLADEGERLFGRGRAISHGVLGPLSIPDWRRFHLIHAEHHLKQIRAIRAAHGL
jgi:hypothetical protein